MACVVVLLATRVINLVLIFSLMPWNNPGTTPQTSTSPTSAQCGGYPSPTYHSGGPYPSYGHHSDPYSQPYTHSHHFYPQPPAHRPWCGADGCTNLVHWEPDVGSFDYCSPECRNKHLLPIQKDQLLSDLKELTELLHTAAVADATESKQVSSSTAGNGPQQKTVCVLLEKTAGRDPGFIFHETRYNNCGLLITGVAVGSAAYKLMQNDKIRFLDVIDKLNDQPVSSLQKSFAGVALEFPLIRMLIKRPISLPPTSKLISDIMKFNSSIPPTHIVVLRSTYILKNSDEFGLTLSMHPGEGLRVTGISKDKPARQCGLQFDDVIQLFAMVTVKIIGGLHSCLQTSGFFEKSLSDAATNGWSLILAIRRRPGTLI